MAEGSATGAGELEGLLENLRALSGEVTTAAVLGKDGKIRASTVSSGVDRERYAAMITALAGLARRTARENGGSSFEQVRIKGGEEGYVLMIGLEGGETLASTTEPDARVGLVLYDMRNARTEIEQRLRSEREERQ
jgi:predicted regulator of Ras-like GTPase activity (Roadblock/LC7/MglB family)